MEMYRLFSFNAQGHIAEWLYADHRNLSVEFYRQAIKHYDSLEKLEKTIAEQGIEELFFKNEVEELKEKIFISLGWQTNVVKVDLPTVRFPNLLKARINPYWFKDHNLNLSFQVKIFMP